MFTFTQISATILALVSVASATITIENSNIQPNGTSSITWSSSAPDSDAESFSIELINAIFNSQFALANNVPTSQNSIDFQLPVVPSGDGYTIEFVSPGNINDIIATSSPFSIEGTGVSGASAASSSSSASTISTAASTGSRSGILTSSTGSQTASGSQASSTVPASASASASASATASSTGSASASASGSAASAKPSNAAAGLAPAGSLAVLIAGAVALSF